MIARYDVGEQRCPACHEKVNGATAVDQSGDAPKAGDLGVCWTCGAMLVYDEKQRVRLVRSEELDEWELDSPDAVRLLRLVAEAVRRQSASPPPEPPPGSSSTSRG